LEKIMFCDRCGSTLDDNAQFCRACGKPVGGVPALPAQTSISGHVRLLGILWIALSALHLLPAVVLLGIGRRLAMHTGIPAFVQPILAAVGVALAVSAIFGIIAGWGLLERQPWSRMLAIVLGCVLLLNLPLGTALGVYTLWVLLPARAEGEFRQLSA
jgi:hypothetical protein